MQDRQMVMGYHLSIVITLTVLLLCCWVPVLSSGAVGGCNQFAKCTVLAVAQCLVAASNRPKT